MQGTREYRLNGIADVGHSRNHAFFAKESDWDLSPAYDLTPTVPVSMDQRDQALECGDTGRFANASNLLSQSARFLLRRGEAAPIVDTMESQVRGIWYATARAAGVLERDFERIASALSYPGFR